MRIVVFCPNLVGDTVMATPTFRALRHGFPEATIVGVIKPQVAPTLDANPWFDELIRFDPHSKDRDQRTIATLGRVRRGQFDVAVILPNSIRSAWMSWAARIPRRIGYARHGRELLLTDRLHYAFDSTGRRLPSPIVHSYLELARRLGCRVDSLRIELATTNDDEAAADRAYLALGLRRDQRVACLNNGGAFGPAKSWPVPHCAELARKLADRARVSILVVCGPAEREAAEEIVRTADHPRVVSLACQPLGLGLTKACVRRSALLITTDSGPRHFAAAFNVPVITLFGPTHIAWTRTYNSNAVHVLHPVPCGPCQRGICPEGHHRCMRDLTPDSVLEVALRMLGTMKARVSPLSIFTE
jgi:heptosyltransferase-2